MPQSNGFVERRVQTIKKGLGSLHATTLLVANLMDVGTPAEVFFGRKVFDLARHLPSIKTILCRFAEILITIFK